MDRTQLEAFDRDTLISHAEKAGVSRPRILTRPELIDELLMRASRDADLETTKKARGFFGMARDLLARVVERGLHLPDAADRIRASAPPPPLRHSTPPLPTVTLAEIYATQGHVDRALETLGKVLDREPDHAAARSLVTRLTDASFQAPKPLLPPEEEVSIAPPPVRVIDRDHCVAFPIDDATAFVSWAITDATFAKMSEAEPRGALALRLLAIVPSWDGPHKKTIDVQLRANVGEHLAYNLPVGAILRAAVGFRIGDRFVPLAHSPALENAEGATTIRDTSSFVRWTMTGAQPLATSDDDAQPIGIAIDLARRTIAESTAKYARV
jgi:hypothetical protein